MSTVTQSTPQPMAEAIAAKFVKMGAHVIFTPRGTKACKVAGWEQIATNDLDTALGLAQKTRIRTSMTGRQEGRHLGIR